MLLRLFTWFVSRYRPTLLSPIVAIWLLVNMRLLTIAATIKMRNREQYDPDLIKRDTWFLVVKGELLYHLKHDGQDHPRHAWTYEDPINGTMRVLHLRAGDRMYVRPGAHVFVELFDATTTEQRLLDFPRWMTVEEVQRSTARQAWFFIITVGPDKIQENNHA